MKFKSGSLFFITLFLVFSCYNNWEDHYNIYPETVDGNVWDAMQKDPEISEFVQLLKDFKYDTLFLTDIAYTVFAPVNSVLSQYKSQNTIDQAFINYHLSSHFVQSGSFVGKRRIQTLGEKFALFEKYGNDLKMDGHSIKKESPLYKNGKYFLLEDVAKPLPNLYEYFKVNNPILCDYVDSQDSIILDRELSKPIGFNEKGETIFDSVVIIYNKFEDEFFPIRKEYRNQSATFVFPKTEDYNRALTQVAQKVNVPGFIDYTDIPLDWQNEVLLPYLLEQGVFENMLEPEEFVWKTTLDTLKLRNILGDSIKIFYSPTEKTICSNGYAYNYSNFQIPDSIHSGSVKYEAELLLDQTGISRYAWNKLAKVQSDQFFAPLQEYISTASNDSIIRVLFPKGYNKKFSLEFYADKLFPRKYVMIVATHMNIGGIWEIYVNDKLTRTFDYYDYTRYKQVLPSVTGSRYIPTGSFNKFDMYVDNIAEYSRPKIRFEYKAPGSVLNNGLVIDYVDFVPAQN